MWSRCLTIYASMEQCRTLTPLTVPYLLYPSLCPFHCSPSYIVLLSSHHMPIPLQSRFPDFLLDFPTFVAPFILSFLILSSFVNPHIHRSIRIPATSKFFSCAFFNAHVSSPYTRAGLTTVLYTFSLIVYFSVTQHYRHTLPVFHPL